MTSTYTVFNKEYPNVEPYVFKEAFTQLSRKLIAEKAIQEMQRVIILLS